MTVIGSLRVEAGGTEARAAGGPSIRAQDPTCDCYESLGSGERLCRLRTRGLEVVSQQLVAGRMQDAGEYCESFLPFRGYVAAAAQEIAFTRSICFVFILRALSSTS